MALVGWAILGLVAGAAGSEVLRVAKRGLVEKVERSASRFVDCLCSRKSPDEKAGAESADGAEDE